MAIAEDEGLGSVPDSGNTRLRTNIVSAIRFSMGGIMASIGLLHIIDPWHFLISIKSYQLVPTSVAVVLATSIPLVQMVVGFQLLFRAWVREAFMILTVLLGCFTLAEVSAQLRDLDIQCGCLGRFSPDISWYTITFTFGLFVVCLVGAIYPAEPASSKEDPQTPLRNSTEELKTTG